MFTYLTAEEPSPVLTYDIYPDTWVAHDDLSRNMPAHKEVGAIKKDKKRVVSIFYCNWNSDDSHDGLTYMADVNKILKKDLDARLDANCK